MPKIKIIISSLLVLLLVLAIGGWYAFNKPHRSLSDSTFIKISADSLLASYQKDESVANSVYLDKPLFINGEIAEINTNQAGEKVIILKTSDPISGVVCTLREKLVKIPKIGQQISIKGFCSGFISDIVLRDCQLETVKE